MLPKLSQIQYVFKSLKKDIITYPQNFSPVWTLPCCAMVIKNKASESGCQG